jgi:hypothetical protein
VAWERCVIPRRWPDWAPHLRQVDTVRDRIVPGLSGQAIGPLGLDLRLAVVDPIPRFCDPRWRVHPGLHRSCPGGERPVNDSPLRTSEPEGHDMTHEASNDTIQQRAKAAAESEENAAERDRNQRRGVDDDRPAQNPDTE